MPASPSRTSAGSRRCGTARRGRCAEPRGAAGRKPKSFSHSCVRARTRCPRTGWCTRSPTTTSSGSGAPRLCASRSTCFDLYGRNQATDPLTVTAHLTQEGHLEKAGGSDYIAALVNGPSPSRSWLTEAERVQSAAMLRRTKRGCCRRR
ncbi:DnaB-like helicase N-terminal domain-containing protein [Streptomyces sp. NPDC001816]|uniref:DnaB-like helicase N-terminal domain-containing protein n=1 Tax=Streptomyces sp. NPDC001816 TaxID=3364612 RepID=UPI0036B32FE8